MLEKERKIGIVVTSNGNRIMGLIREESDTKLSVYRPIVIVRGEFNKSRTEGDIVLSNFDSMIGLNIIDQIETMYITNPSFYSFFEKEIKSYRKFHATSYDSIKQSFTERYAQSKSEGILDPKDQVNEGVANFQQIEDEPDNQTKDCGCKSKQAAQKIVDKFKEKFKYARKGED